MSTKKEFRPFRISVRASESTIQQKAKVLRLLKKQGNKKPSDADAVEYVFNNYQNTQL